MGCQVMMMIMFIGTETLVTQVQSACKPKCPQPADRAAVECTGWLTEVSKGWSECCEAVKRQAYGVGTRG